MPSLSVLGEGEVRAILEEHAPLNGTNRMKAILALSQAGMRGAAEQNAAIDAFARKAAAGKFAGVRGDALKSKPIRFLEHPWYPLGVLSLEYGEEGTGKGVDMADLAARVTTGELGDGQGTVEWIAFEDDAADVVKARIIAAGGDPSRVIFHEATEDGETPLTLPDDLLALEDAIRERGSILVIIDPLADALRDDLSQNANGDVRQGIVPLQGMARRLGIAVVGVAHPNKGGSTAADKVMGSKAWRTVPRSVTLWSRDPSNPNGDTRIRCLTKANLAGRKISERVTIEGVQVTDPDTGENVGVHPRIAGREPSEWTDGELVIFNATGKLPGDAGVASGTKLERGALLITELLTAGAGEVDAKVAYAAGVAEGLSESTMREARKRARVVEQGGKWMRAEDADDDGLAY